MIGLSRNQDPNSASVRNTKLPILAALSGVAVGALAAFAVTVPTMQHSFALQTRDLRNKLALTAGYSEESQAPETAVLPAECVQPGMGAVLGVSTVAPSEVAAPGMGAVLPSESNQIVSPSENQQQQENKQFVKKLMAGTLVKAVISNTGPYSSNTINTNVENKVNITNKNDIEVNNQVDQWSRSGSANVSNNTNAGSATSGSADNSSSNSFTISVNNNSN